MEELANLGASSLIRGSLFRDTSLYGKGPTRIRQTTVVVWRILVGLVP